jgi:glucokinase
VSTVVAGVDIGGTTTQVVLSDESLAVLGRAEVATPVGGEAMVAAPIALIRQLLEETGSTLGAVAVGAAGVVDSRTGTVLVASDSFVNWGGFAVTDTITAALGVPSYLDNDVNAFLRGEAAAGSLRGETDALGITLGTGVGGALWLHGDLHHGQHGAAGEIGHIPGFGDLPCTCGARGHLETLASGLSIARRYTEASGQPARGARDVADAADRGDAAALSVFADAGAALARAILMTVGLVDVATVVIGGGVSNAWHLLHPAITAALVAEPPVNGRTITVVRATLGPDAVALGACARALTALQPA